MSNSEQCFRERFLKLIEERKKQLTSGEDYDIISTSTEALEVNSSGLHE